MDNPSVVHRLIRKYKDSEAQDMEDAMAVESPLVVESRIGAIATALRLPGDDERLAAGLLLHEGIVDRREDILGFDRRPDPASDRLVVELSPEALERQAALAAQARPPRLTGRSPFFAGRGNSRDMRLPAAELMRLKGVFEGLKDIHPLTGATHSASIFDTSIRTIAYAEDIGRHNALDKAAGRLLLEGRDREAYLCVMSSRQSYEMVVKAGRLGVSILVGVSTVTSLAMDLAGELGITLIGFFRKNRMNVYTHAWRLEDHP